MSGVGTPVTPERRRWRACTPCDTDEQVLAAVEPGWLGLARLALRHLRRLGVSGPVDIVWESGTLALVPVPANTRLRVRRCLAAVQRMSARVCALCGRWPASVHQDPDEPHSDWRDRPLCAIHCSQTPYVGGHARLWRAHRAIAAEGPPTVRALVRGARVTPAAYRAAVRALGRMLVRRGEHGTAEWLGLARWAIEDGVPSPAHRAALRPTDLLQWLGDHNPDIRASALAVSALIPSRAERAETGNHAGATGSMFPGKTDIPWVCSVHAGTPNDSGVGSENQGEVA